MNSLLSEDYRVTINTEDYKKHLEDRTVYQCSFCTTYNQKAKQSMPTETPFNKITILEVPLPLIDKILSKTNTTHIWVCPKCHNENHLEKTQIITEETAQPFYRKVVPSCPVKLAGISYSLDFDNAFQEWFYNFAEELEHQLGLYRIEYVSQNEMNMVDESGYIDTGDD